MKNVILSEAKDLKRPRNEILRYTQNDKKREKCFFTQSDTAGKNIKSVKNKNKTLDVYPG